jgi:tRNA (cmo5U34)-methyltransferase
VSRIRDAASCLVLPRLVCSDMREEMLSSASGYFGSMVESYDSLIRRAVPRYDEMTFRLLEYLPEKAERILELGCGTGNLSLFLARKFPTAWLTLVDGSPDMVAVACARIEDAGPDLLTEASFIAARFEELELPEHPFDLVVSSISLHHVSDKASLYRWIRSALRAGGRFCFADQIRGEPESNHRVNWDRWLEFCRAPGNCSEEEIESLLEHAAAHDHYTRLSDHISQLARAGFGEIDCVWRNLMWGIVTASAV